MNSRKNSIQVNDDEDEEDEEDYDSPKISGRSTLDLPVDPNEPVYCFCKNVSYGEMIACDNENVSTPNRMSVMQPH